MKKSLEKIALDIVVLLPQEIKDICIQLDRGSERSKEVSFEEGYEPHITLSMECVQERDLPEIAEKIETILKNHNPLSLAITGFHKGKSSWLDIEKTDELQKLHTQINTMVKGFRTHKATAQSFFEYKERAPQQTLIDWVNNFISESSGEKYDPHISMGSEITYVPEFPIRFVADTIGMFQLGYHGTCKNELARCMLK